MNDTNQIDLSALQNLLDTVGGDWSFLAELAEEYFNNTPRLLEEIKSGLAASDAALVRRAAHSLKSNSASFGAMALSELCKQVEYAARDGNLGGLSESLARIEEGYAQAIEILRAEIARGVASSNAS